jgi:hypothetical protein
LHGLAHDLGLDLPRAPLGRSLDLAMAVLGAAVGIFGAKLGAHADPSGEARLRLALVTELDRTALPLAAGLLLGALLAIARTPKFSSLLGGYARAATASRGGVLAPETFLLTLSHFGFPLALLRDLLSALGLALRGAPAESLPAADGEAANSTESSSEAAQHPLSAGLFERVDVIVPWAALGVLVSAVIRASVPDFALECSLWLALLAAVAFALSVKVHAVAAVPLAFALADRGLPLAAALVILILAPFALDLRKLQHWLFIAVPCGLGLFFAEHIPRTLLMADSRAATVASACIGVVLLVRAYQLGFRGLLLPIVRTE